MKVNQPQGEKCMFTGGNEITPLVEVVIHSPPALSLQEPEKVLRISQNGQYVQISLDTLNAIIGWSQKG